MAPSAVLSLFFTTAGPLDDGNGRAQVAAGLDWITAVGGCAALLVGLVLLWVGCIPSRVGSRLPVWSVLLFTLGAIAGAAILALTATDTSTDIDDPVYSVGWAIVLPFAVLVLAVSGVLALVAGISLAQQEPKPAAPRAMRSRTRRRTGVIAGVGLLLFVGFGGYVSLVLSPEAQVPGWSLARIYGALGDDLELDRGSVVTWLASWTIITLILVLVCLLPSPTGRGLNVVLRPRIILVVALVIMGLVAYSQWPDYFSIGLDLGDIGPLHSGGDSFASIMYIYVGEAAIVVALLLGVAPRRRLRLTIEEPIPVAT
jgi:hypothetical protein